MSHFISPRRGVLASAGRFAVPVVAIAGLIAAIGWINSESESQYVSADEVAVQQKQDTPKPSALQRFMRAKLGASNQVLEGLVTENYRLIETGAKKLEELSSAEQWRISNDVMYRQHSAEFQQKVKQLRRAGIEKNIDAASLAYVQTTLSCVECHKWVRAVLVTDARPSVSLIARPDIRDRE